MTRHDNLSKHKNMMMIKYIILLAVHASSQTLRRKMPHRELMLESYIPDLSEEKGFCQSEGFQEGYTTLFDYTLGSGRIRF